MSDNGVLATVWLVGGYDRYTDIVVDLSVPDPIGTIPETTLQPGENVECVILRADEWASTVLSIGLKNNGLSVLQNKLTAIPNTIDSIIDELDSVDIPADIKQDDMLRFIGKIKSIIETAKIEEK